MIDLDLQSVFRKTVVGTEAIKVRDRALTPKMRMLLIMVDGVKTGTDLLKLVSNADEARQLLTELMSSGYAEQIKVPKPVAPAPVVAPTKAASTAADNTLKVSIRRATRLLEDLLGPSSVDLCLQLERCTSDAQLKTKVAELSRIVAAMRSERKAAEFLLAATE